MKNSTSPTSKPINYASISLILLSVVVTIFPISASHGVLPMLLLVVIFPSLSAFLALVLLLLFLPFTVKVKNGLVCFNFILFFWIGSYLLQDDLSTTDGLIAKISSIPLHLVSVYHAIVLVRYSILSFHKSRTK